MPVFHFTTAFVPRWGCYAHNISHLLPMCSHCHAACTASVQQSLAKEVVIWKQGILVLPPIIHDTVACMQARTQALVV